MKLSSFATAPLPPQSSGRLDLHAAGHGGCAGPPLQAPTITSIATDPGS